MNLRWCVCAHGGTTCHAHWCWHWHWHWHTGASSEAQPPTLHQHTMIDDRAPAADTVSVPPPRQVAVGVHGRGLGVGAVVGVHDGAARVVSRHNVGDIHERGLARHCKAAVDNGEQHHWCQRPRQHAGELSRAWRRHRVARCVWGRRGRGGCLRPLRPRRRGPGSASQPPATQQGTNTFVPISVCFCFCFNLSTGVLGNGELHSAR